MQSLILFFKLIQLNEQMLFLLLELVLLRTVVSLEVLQFLLQTFDIFI